MLARLLTLAALAALAYIPAAGSASLAAPSGVHAFMLRADEQYQDTFSRTPSFAWQPYEGATRYDFQLATGTKFDERTIVWTTDSSKPLHAPAATVPLALPWMTGRPYALYARVRAHTARGVTAWSKPFGFNTQWEALPEQITPDVPGLVRWTPVEGATSYEVWFVNADKLVATTTNVADERDYYSASGGPKFGGEVLWRVRAVRKLYGGFPNALPAVSYGPWSPVFFSVASPVTAGTVLAPSKTVSDVLTENTGSIAHSLTPGFSFSGAVTGQGTLYRVYVATDRRCVNIVYVGAAVGSPAWAPRTGAVGDGAAPGTAADGQKVVPTESLGSVGPQPIPPGSPSTSGAVNPTDSGPAVDLWDLGRTNARYWWTVVPVATGSSTPATGSSTPATGSSTSGSATTTGSGTSALRDLGLPQDTCDGGWVMEFAKTSAPATTALSSPYVSGLSRFGDLVTASTKVPSFYGAPVVAWEPARGATEYEVQWSRTRTPWRTAGSAVTASTSTLLDQLTPGTWFYRVRGIDPYVTGPVKQMTWSTSVKFTIARPRFLVQSGVTTRRVKK
jgi:hypothetical protein